MKNKMLKKDSQIFASIVFYVFTFTLISFAIITPIVLYLGAELVDVLYALWYMAIALSMIFVIMGRIYHLFSPVISSFFKNWFLPIIPLQSSSKIIFRLQFTLFNLLKIWSIVIVVNYALASLIGISPFAFFSTCFELLSAFFAWVIAFTMTADGIFIYSVCLYRVVSQFRLYIISKKSNKPMRLLEKSAA